MESDGIRYRVFMFRDNVLRMRRLKAFAIIAVVTWLLLPHWLRAGSKPDALEITYLGNEGFLSAQDHRPFCSMHCSPRAFPIMIVFPRMLYAILKQANLPSLTSTPS